MICKYVKCSKYFPEKKRSRPKIFCTKRCSTQFNNEKDKEKRHMERNLKKLKHKDILKKGHDNELLPNPEEHIGAHRMAFLDVEDGVFDQGCCI